MGFFGRLAHKVSSGASRLGHKVSSGARVAVKSVTDHAGEIANVSGKIAKVAKVISKVSTAALPFTAEIPIVGEAVAGTAALSKGVAIVASGVNRVAKGVNRANKVAKLLT